MPLLLPQLVPANLAVTVCPFKGIRGHPKVMADALGRDHAAAIRGIERPLG